MVVRYFNVFRTICARGPFEAQSPLPVDPDAVLALPVAGQSLQVIAGELRKIPQAGGRFQHPQALFSLMAEALKRRNALAFGKASGPCVLVTPHQNTVCPTVRGTSSVPSAEAQVFPRRSAGDRRPLP